MKFYVSTAFLDTREAVEIAKAADDLGYHGMAIPDHRRHHLDHHDGPWMFNSGPDASPDDKIDGMRRFREDLGPAWLGPE